MNGSRKRFTAYDTQSYYFIKNKPSYEHKVPLLVLPPLLIFSLAFFNGDTHMLVPSPFGGGLPSLSVALSWDVVLFQFLFYLNSLFVVEKDSEL